MARIEQLGQRQGAPGQFPIGQRLALAAQFAASVALGAQRCSPRCPSWKKNKNKGRNGPEMAQLIPIVTPLVTTRHVVFVHGLRRVGVPVWMSSSVPPEKWPAWLGADIPECAIWSLEHESAPTIFRGRAMHLVDRANNCLPLLLSEPALKNGEIAFVTHSFGGLIIAELVRVAHGRSIGEGDVADFLQRVRRIAFLGTPHLGADLASLGGRLALISRAARGLPRNAPHLRGLNQWFRRYVDDHDIATLTLTESYRTGLFGQIVKPDSADFGLSSFPIPVDANHFTIASPADRNSEVYRHIRDFLTQPEPPAHPQATIAKASSDQAASIAQLTQQNAEGFQRLEERLAGSAIKQASILKIPQGLVDAEAGRRLLVLLRSRFFVGVNVKQDAARLANDLIEGDLEATSALTKTEALAWCARLLLSDSDNSEPKKFLGLARRLAKCTAIEIAESFLAFYEGRSADALLRLSMLNTSESKSAAFIIVVKSRSPEEALQWLHDTRTDISTMDADGKVFVLNSQLECSRWVDALETAESLRRTTSNVRRSCCTSLRARTWFKQFLMTCALKRSRNFLWKRPNFLFHRAHLLSQLAAKRKICIIEPVNRRPTWVSPGPNTTRAIVHCGWPSAIKNFDNKRWGNWNQVCATLRIPFAALRLPWTMD